MIEYLFPIPEKSDDSEYVEVPMLKWRRPKDYKFTMRQIGKNMDLKALKEKFSDNQVAIIKLIDIIEVQRDALEFACGNRCAIGLNECNSREALTKTDAMLGELNNG